MTMTPLILTVDGDRRQSAQVAAFVKASIEAEMVQAATASEGLEALRGRVPDLILTSPLLSPKDDGLIAAHLRQLGRAAAHVQTLTIPMLRKGTPKAKVQRGVLAALRRGKPSTSDTDGCDPQVFAEQVRLYLATAAEYRDATASQAEPVAVEAAHDHVVLEAPEAVTPEASTWASAVEAPAAATIDVTPAWDEPSMSSITPEEPVDESASAPADDQQPAGDEVQFVDAGAVAAPPTAGPLEILAESSGIADLAAGGDSSLAEHVSPSARDVSVEALAALFDLDGPSDVDLADPAGALGSLDDESASAPADNMPLAAGASAAVTEPSSLETPTGAEAVIDTGETASLDPQASGAPIIDVQPVEQHDQIEAAPSEAALAVPGEQALFEPEPSVLGLTGAEAAETMLLEPVLAEPAAHEEALPALPLEPALSEAAEPEYALTVASTVASERVEPAMADTELANGAPLADAVAADGTAEISQNAEERATARAVAAFVQEPGAFAEFYVQTPAADAWAALTTQPLSALTRPEEHSEHRVPLVDMGACEDLDLLARGLAAPGGSAAADLFVPPALAPAIDEPGWMAVEPVSAAPPAAVDAAGPVPSIVAAPAEPPSAPVIEAPTAAPVDEPALEPPVLVSEAVAVAHELVDIVAEADDTPAESSPMRALASDDDAAVEAVKPLLYAVFADEFEEALEPGETVPAVAHPEVVDDAPALAAAHDPPQAPPTLEPVASAPVVTHDVPPDTLEEFLHDDLVPPSPLTPPGDDSWALPVLDAEALAMIGDAAVRALDTAVLRDFEMALAACDENGTPWHDSPETGPVMADAGTGATAPAQPVPNEPALPRVAVEFETKPPADDWSMLGAAPAPLAALVDKRGPKGDRPREAVADRAKARVAAH